MRELTAEVAVIGSGMGGGTAALALARRGRDVLVVERGRRLPREAANWSPQAVFGDGRYRPRERWSDAGGGTFAPGVHYVVGGNTKVYGASLPRLRERDFLNTAHPDGVSPAWPFDYADLEPYYAEAERIFRVHGDGDDDPGAAWRSGPFPFPALDHEPYITELAARLQARGVRPVSNAMGIDWRPGGGCLRCATCDGFPCRVAAKSDAETCAINPALATGHARLAEGVRVTRLVTSANGARVTHAEAVDAEGPLRVSAERFVLSAGAVNSAALLLGSAADPHPNGLANRSGQVGRNFMMHNNAHIVAIDLHRSNDVVFQKTLSVTQWYDDDGAGRPLGTLQLIGKVRGPMMRGAAPRGVPVAVLDRIAARSVEWLVMAEDLPSPANRVTLAADGSISVARRALGTGTHRRLLRRARRLLRSIGYEAVLTQPFDLAMNSHQCGTVVCGADPADSVLDPFCRAHDVGNLWVIDGGFFPSSGAMNPALTIAAQALRAVAESPLGA